MLGAKGREAPSPWFVWHAGVLGRGSSVLDIGCGRGRHAIAAAELGARVLALDNDPAKLKAAEKVSRQARVCVTWQLTDLVRGLLPEGDYDVVMMFYYLDRRRLPDFLQRVRPGGYVLAETFLTDQRELGWGPTSDEHLLNRGELASLIGHFELIQGREVLEVLDGHPRAVASVLARRPPE